MPCAVFKIGLRRTARLMDKASRISPIEDGLPVQTLIAILNSGNLPRVHTIVGNIAHQCSYISNFASPNNREFNLSQNK